MATISDYLENELVKHIFRTGSFTKPSTLAIALLTIATNDTGTGEFSSFPGTEVPNTQGYARLSNNPSDANWVELNGLTWNSKRIFFPEATGSWGTILATALVDSASHDVGNMLFYGATLPASIPILAGDTLGYEIANFTCSIA